MNILFYSLAYPSPLSGGVERVTDNICTALQTRYNHSCFVLYEVVKAPIEATLYETHQISSPVDVSSVSEYIKSKAVDVIIIQNLPEIPHVLRQATKNLNIKIICVFHNAPDYPYMTLTLDYILDIMRYRNNGGYSFKHLLKYPLKKLKLRYLQYLYHRNILNDVDRLVFLSSYNQKEYFKYSLKNVDNISDIICNPLSFNVNISADIFLHKQNRVLVVARFEEYTKRLLLALKIWGILQEKYNLHDWHLDIVGSGPDEDLYQSFMQRHSVSNVTFWGQQDPRPFYEKASVLMMTSRTEGFPLVLLEAMQYGCVPIAFSSFPSANDIISDNHNGCLVRYPDVNAYAKKLAKLAVNEQERKFMAENAMNSLKRYDFDEIIEKWQQLILSNS